MKNYVILFIFIIGFHPVLSQWEITGWRSDPITSQVYPFGDTIIVVEDEALISIDKGINWKPLFDESNNILFYNVIFVNNILFLNTQSNGIFSSTDLGKTWLPKNNGLINGLNKWLYNNEDILFVIIPGGNSAGIYISKDFGDSWTKKNNGLPEPGELLIKTIAFNDSKIYVGTLQGVFISHDMGENWISKSEGLPAYPIPSYFVFNDKNEVFLILNDFIEGYHKFYISKDGGDTWIEKANTIDDAKFTITYTSINDTIFIGAESDLYMSTDFGDTWNKLNDIKQSDDWELYSLTSSGSVIYVCLGGELLKSTDLGETWFELKPKKYRYGMVNSMVMLKDKLIVASDRIFPYLNPPGLYISTDFGESWSNTFPNIIYDREEYIYKTTLAVHNDIIFLGTNEGLFRSTDIGESWEELYEERKLDVISFAFSGDTVFASADWKGGVYMSPDLGISWRKLGNNGLPINKRIASIALAGNQLFIQFLEKEGIFRTSDVGENWASVNNGLPEKADFHELYSYNNNLYLNIRTSDITNDKGIYFSSDFGDTWELRNNGFPSYPKVGKFYGVGNLVFASVEPGELYTSSDQGINWIKHSNEINVFYINNFAHNEEYIFASRIQAIPGKNGTAIFRARLSDFGITDMQESLIASQFSIHPNPATEYIEIYYGNNGAGSIENNIWVSPNASNIKIFNTLGECVMTVETIHELSLQSIDISHLPRGVFYLRIGNRTQMFVKM